MLHKQTQAALLLLLVIFQTASAGWHDHHLQNLPGILNTQQKMEVSQARIASAQEQTAQHLATLIVQMERMLKLLEAQQTRVHRDDCDIHK